MATILEDTLFDDMNALVDELFEAEAVDELKSFGKDVWRNVKPTGEAPNVTVLVFNRIQAALDCLSLIQEHRSNGIFVSKYSGRMRDLRSPRAKQIQDGIEENDEIDFSHKAMVRRELSNVKERAAHLA